MKQFFVFTESGESQTKLVLGLLYYAASLIATGQWSEPTTSA